MKMVYRADGLRAWVIASSTTSGNVTAETEKVYSYYDGGNAVLETGEDGSVLSTNVFAPDGLVARSFTPAGLGTTSEEEGEAVATLMGSSYVGEYMFDWQGNVTHILSPSFNQILGQPTSYDLIHCAYNAWGQKNFLYPANVNSELHRFGYNGRWGYRTDTETGLMYCQNRYYDAANGRWLTRDPISYSGGVNLYGYCGGNGVGRMDSSGMNFEDSHYTQHDQALEAWRRRGIPPGMKIPGDWSREQTDRAIKDELERLGDEQRNDWRNALPGGGCLSALDYVEEKLRWFERMMNDGQPWDFKNNGSGLEPFGNWHYGYAAEKAGIGEQITDRAAGYNQWQKKRGKYKDDPKYPSHGYPWGSAPFGDTEEDQDLIKKGREEARKPTGRP